MHILVTGGAGFIGSHVVERLLAAGHRVTVLDDLSSGKRSNIPANLHLIVGDVADGAAVEAAADTANAIIHLAAIASVQVCEAEPARAARTNVAGTETIFAAAAARGIPVVYASSAAVYGDTPNLPLAETARPQPLGAYGQHKLENEAIAARNAAKVPSVGLRFFNVYGPRQDAASPYSGVISKFVANARAGQPLTFFGDGEQTRDFIYVGDIVALIMASLASATDGARVLNGCTGRATSLKQLAAGVAEAIGTPLSIQHAPARDGDIRHSLGDPAAAHAALGFQATTPLATGLAALVAHA